LLDPLAQHVQLLAAGRIEFPDVFAAIERSAYQGWTGAEYFPRRPTPETLGWFEPYRR
jgi:hydroxypyruvate isomerase